MNLKKLFQVFSCNKTMKIILFFKTQPFENTFVTSGRVARRTGKYKVISRVITSAVFRYQMVRCKIIFSTAKYTLLWKIMFSFPFSYCIRYMNFITPEFFKSVCDKSIVYLSSIYATIIVFCDIYPKTTSIIFGGENDCLDIFL